MALSQVEAGYRVSVIAQDPASRPYVREGVEIIPIGTFGRLTWRRIWSNWKIRKLARKLAADVYQVHTVELLAMAKKLKQQLPRAKVIYDVHEDYIGNIRYADYYPEWSRSNLIARVRDAQNDFCRWGDGVIYAEECFDGMLAFDRDRTVLARNKFQKPRSIGKVKIEWAEPQLPVMLYSGTIAENWGVLRAIQFWAMLNFHRPVNLLIAGHTQDKEILALIAQEVRRSGHSQRFAMVGGATYVPFEDLVSLIEGCTFGVALYNLRENIKDRIPTKFYEFMAMGKPLMFSQNPSWDALNARNGFGLSLPWPPQPSEIATIWDRIHALINKAGSHRVPESSWSWDAEAPQMLGLLRKLTQP